MADHETTAAQGPTPVTIFGRTYHLRGGGDPGYLGELAGHVDRTMREIAGATGTADTLKVAILACLNLADESEQAGRATRGSLSAASRKRLARLVTALDEVLDE